MRLQHKKSEVIMTKSEISACNFFLTSYDDSLETVEQVLNDSATIVWEPFEHIPVNQLLTLINQSALKHSLSGG